MKRINIFKPGKHTDSSGHTLEFSEDKLSASASAYDPELHEAPIVIGHPKDNHPAYGWVKSMEFSDGLLDVIPHQLNADFADMVTSGAFKKVSASFYLPDAPNNPKPGTLYLRHVGFLGAQPPAIKGLKAVEFSEAEEGVVEFEETWQRGWMFSSIGDVLKNLREFIIDKFSKDEADKAIPNYVIDDLKRSAESLMKEPENPSSTPVTDFSETRDKPEPETVDMNELEKAKAQVATLEAEKTKLENEKASLATKVAEFEEQENQRKRAALIARVDALVASGKIKPADKSRVLAFAERLGNQTVDFGEGEGEKGLDAQDAYLKQFENAKALVSFNEQSGDDGEQDPEPVTAKSISVKAVEYQEEQRKAGRTVSITDAVNHVMKDAE